jgi:Autographiviridae endonuclease VII
MDPERPAFKTCRKCGETKPLDEFYAEKAGRDGRRTECKVCSKAAMAARYRANPDPARERARRWNRENRDRYDDRMRAYRESGRKKLSDRKSHLKRKYGLTVEQYDEVLAAQGGGCAICGRLPRDDISLHVDHCHLTNDVRGILCFRCNNALGDFDHDERLLRAAADYLAGATAERIRRRAAALTSQA